MIIICIFYIYKYMDIIKDNLSDICRRFCSHHDCKKDYCEAMRTFPIFTQAFLLYQELIKLRSNKQYPQLQEDLKYLKRIQNENPENDENWNDNLSHEINNRYNMQKKSPPKR